MAVAMHATSDEEDAALMAHHLAAFTTEWRIEGNQEIGPIEIFVDNGQIGRRPFSEENYRPLEEFAQVNPDYLADLKAFVEDRVGGLS